MQRFSVPSRRIHTVLAAVAVLVAAIVLLVPASAVPAGRIALSGAFSGSHLKLETEGDRIVVKGNLGEAEPAGCERMPRGHGAICSLKDVYGMEISWARPTTRSRS